MTDPADLSTAAPVTLRQPIEDDYAAVARAIQSWWTLPGRRTLARCAGPPALAPALRDDEPARRVRRRARRLPRRLSVAGPRRRGLHPLRRRGARSARARHRPPALRAVLRDLPARRPPLG